MYLYRQYFSYTSFVVFKIWVDKKVNCLTVQSVNYMMRYILIFILLKKDTFQKINFPFLRFIKLKASLKTFQINPHGTMYMYYYMTLISLIMDGWPPPFRTPTYLVPQDSERRNKEDIRGLDRSPSRRQYRTGQDRIG